MLFSSSVDRSVLRERLSRWRCSSRISVHGNASSVLTMTKFIGDVDFVISALFTLFVFLKEKQGGFVCAHE